MRTLIISLFLMLGSIHAMAEEPRSSMHGIMKERAKIACRNLGEAFIQSRDGFKDAKVQSLAGNCYAAKARLHLFGDHQQLIVAGTGSLLPCHHLATGRASRCTKCVTRGR